MPNDYRALEGSERTARAGAKRVARSRPGGSAHRQRTTSKAPRRPAASGISPLLARPRRASGSIFTERSLPRTTERHRPM